MNKAVGVFYFKALLQHLYGAIEKNSEKSVSIKDIRTQK
jgi:hypothetical protein